MSLPLQTPAITFNTVLGVVPFTGDVRTVKNAFTGGVGFVIGQTKPSAPADKFVAWSNITNSLSKIIKAYHASISNALEHTLTSKPLDETSGIVNIISGGIFLGATQNFTQADLPEQVTDVIARFAIGQTLAANGIYVFRFHNPEPCLEDDVSICQSNGKSMFNVILKQNDIKAATDASKKPGDKYGMKKEDYLANILNCWGKNGFKNLVDPFADDIPIDICQSLYLQPPIL